MRRIKQAVLADYSWRIRRCAHYSMKSSIRVSQRLLVLVFALLMHSTTCFQVRTAQQHTVATPSTSLSRRRSAAVLDNRRSCYALTVRGGATQRTGPLQALMVDTLAVVNSFYQNSPYVAAALTCGTKASAADYVAQRRQSKKDLDIASKMDTARNVAFLLYGAVYQGMAQEVRMQNQLVSCLFQQSYVNSHFFISLYTITSIPFGLVQARAWVRFSKRSCLIYSSKRLSLHFQSPI